MQSLPNRPEPVEACLSALRANRPRKTKRRGAFSFSLASFFDYFFARNLFRSVDESGMLRIPFERLAFAYLIGGQGAVDVAGEPADGTAAVGVA